MKMNGLEGKFVKCMKTDMATIAEILWQLGIWNYYT